MLGDALLFLINTLFGLLVYALLLRFYMQALRAPFRNPVGQAVSALTDWIVRPARRLVPGWMGLDLATLLLAWIGQAIWLVSTLMLRNGALGSKLVGVLVSLSLVELIKASLYLLIAVVFVQAILSWVAPYNPIAPVARALSAPFLDPIRRRIPPLGGQLDLSPLILFVICQLVVMVPLEWLERAIIGIAR